ncbi:MAG TPA: response regulator [Planctomycetaceae bacterium]|nr:response regulator [Planctomycetaceae bacterium]
MAGSVRILVVEDEANNVEIITRLLKRQGYEPIVAGNADDAIRLSQSEQPALVLMDITIPERAGEAAHIEGGLRATRDIKAHGPTANLPVLALTARSMPHEQQAMRDAGCDEVAMKPYDFKTLLATMESLLRK